MNEQTTQLIEQLAQKLGTTTEYLWGILLKQAPISAVTNLIFIVLTILAGVGLYKLHKHFFNEDLYGEATVDLPMFIAAAVWVIVFLVAIFSIGSVVNGFLNPEYWALKEVLNAAQ